MPYDIVFKSYCWSVGTTSFRTKHFNEKIEEQLLLLKEFFEFPDVPHDAADVRVGPQL